MKIDDALKVLDILARNANCVEAQMTIVDELKKLRADVTSERIAAAAYVVRASYAEVLMQGDGEAEDYVRRLGMDIKDGKHRK